jgi:hypothetical protein
VWVGFGGLFGELVGAVYAPTLRIAEEEALSGRVAEGILATLQPRGFFLLMGIKLGRSAASEAKAEVT